MPVSPKNSSKKKKAQPPCIERLSLVNSLIEIYGDPHE